MPRARNEDPRAPPDKHSDWGDGRARARVRGRAAGPPYNTILEDGAGAGRQLHLPRQRVRPAGYADPWDDEPNPGHSTLVKHTKDVPD